MRPLLLDLFCCAGGAAVGYHRAGFDVIGVDIVPQPDYPFVFIQADCLTLEPDFMGIFDAVHASPPCQAHSTTRHMTRAAHLDLIPETRAMLRASGKPFIIENVVGAPLIDPIMLCGTMFNLKVYRHRLFESNVALTSPPHFKHVQGSTGSRRGYSANTPMICVAGNNFNREQGAAAMGIDWMRKRPNVAQAIPPAYTEFLGRQIIARIA